VVYLLENQSTTDEFIATLTLEATKTLTPGAYGRAVGIIRHVDSSTHCLPINRHLPLSCCVSCCISAAEPASHRHLQVLYCTGIPTVPLASLGDCLRVCGLDSMQSNMTKRTVQW